MWSLLVAVGFLAALGRRALGALLFLLGRAGALGVGLRVLLLELLERRLLGLGAQPGLLLAALLLRLLLGIGLSRPTLRRKGHTEQVEHEDEEEERRREEARQRAEAEQAALEQLKEENPEAYAKRERPEEGEEGEEGAEGQGGEPQAESEDSEDTSSKEEE